MELREAFSKFGFQDGDGWNGTDIVAEYMEKTFNSTNATAGATITISYSMCFASGVSQIPSNNVGYDEPDE